MVWREKKAHSFICVVSPDRDNYQTLFGVLDNCFLVAYAIGMFIRFVCTLAPRHQCCCLSVSFLSSEESSSLVVFAAGSLESACLCGTT